MSPRITQQRSIEASLPPLLLVPRSMMLLSPLLLLLLLLLLLHCKKAQHQALPPAPATAENNCRQIAALRVIGELSLMCDVVSWSRPQKYLFPERYGALIPETLI